MRHREKGGVASKNKDAIVNAPERYRKKVISFEKWPLAFEDAWLPGTIWPHAQHSVSPFFSVELQSKHFSMLYHSPKISRAQANLTQFNPRKTSCLSSVYLSKARKGKLSKWSHRQMW